MPSPSPNDPVVPVTPRQPPRPKGLAFALSLVVLVMYSAFVLMVGYAKPFLGSLVAPGLSWGILLGALVIVFTWGLMFIYMAASGKPRSED